MGTGLRDLLVLLLSEALAVEEAEMKLDAEEALSVDEAADVTLELAADEAEAVAVAEEETEETVPVPT